MSDLLDAALQYASAGFSVIPVKPDYDAKRKRFVKQSHVIWGGFQQRKATADEIQAWWQKWPTAMIGIVTGALSDLFAIDCDTQKGFEAIQALLPETMLVPTAITPRGGWHLWFKYPQGLTIKAGAIPGVDYRGEGGYIIADPSVNVHGGRYQWLDGLAYNQVNLPSLDSNIILILKKGGVGGNGVSEGVNNCVTPTLTTLTTSDHTGNIWGDGVRDENLFHLAFNLAKQGDGKDFIFQTLMAITKSWGEEDSKWILTKIDSAFKRLETKERNIADEIREFVLTTTGHFLTTDGHKWLHLTTRQEQKAGNMAYLRLFEEGLIERVGNRNGCYRRVERNNREMEFIEEEVFEYPIKLPFGLNDLCKLYPRNIVVIAGSKSAGKTALLLEIMRLNQNNKAVIYLNSEMGSQEWTERLKGLGIKKKKDIKFQALECHTNYHDEIDGSDKIYIVDFLEIHDNFFEIAKPIRQIHEKLKDGICIIAVQKKFGEKMGRGAEFSMEKARLYLSMDFVEDEGGCCRIQIIDAKAPKLSSGVRGFYKRVKIIGGVIESVLDPQWKYEALNWNKPRR